MTKFGSYIYGYSIGSNNSSPHGQKAATWADNIFKYILLCENDRILIQISLKRFPKSPIDNKLALVEVMAWHRIGDKPLLQPMMTQFTDSYMRHQQEMS